METPPTINEDEIAAVASALTPVERAAYLDAACGLHFESRDRIEKRLGLSTNTRPDATDPDLAGLDSEAPGDRLGNYRLLEPIGEGGFGIVWVAEQEAPVRRRVALKLIKPGMDSRQVVARFEQERQALALMDHPNIAKVFDAGVTRSGRPYFVMEYVQGIRITEYCDQSKLSPEERLHLVVMIARAVQHAHQKGIIHRDLKPSNILVTFQDGKPVPKVIDFGVAKAMEPQRLTDLTIFTQIEQMIGTPAYMSPEQALGGFDIDTRTDIYSLGVVLYELLTGMPPFDSSELNQNGVDGIRRLLQEQEPRRPSTLLTTLDADELEYVANRRRSVPSGLISTLRGDLDWIVMKAIEKDRARRYDTANDFAADIVRYLEHQPVIARPPSRIYRIRRFAWRHKAGVTAGVTILVALLTTLGVSLWQTARANYEAERATNALAELSKMAPALSAEARELVTAGRFDEAIEKAGYAIQLRPESVRYLRQRGGLLAVRLKLEEAIADYRRILSLLPGDPTARATLAACENLRAGPQEPDGKFPRTALSELYEALTAEQRSAAELMPLARMLGRENELQHAFWLELLEGLPNPTDRPISERLTSSGGLLDLDLSGTSVSDLGPLKGAPLNSLNLRGCSAIHDLSPLEGMPLRQLELDDTNVSSLEPLAGLQQLEVLFAAGTKISDLRPLQKLPLKKLRIARTGVGDLTPLAGMALQHLEMGRTQVSDLRPLSKMPLEILECSYSPIADFTPLAGTRMVHLGLQGARVGDLQFARNLPLKSLNLTEAREIRNLDVLAGIPTLEILVLPGDPMELPEAEIFAIDKLRGHPALKRISCTLQPGRNLETAEGASIFWDMWDSTMKWWRPLRAANIKTDAKRLPDDTWQVGVANTALQDLSIFSGANISVLNLMLCRNVQDLSPLRDMPLVTLSIAHTSVTDLSPLAQLPVRVLWMADTPVRDLSPLRGTRLQAVYMDKCAAIRDVSPLAGIQTLEQIVLPFGAENVGTLRGLPNLKRISYTFDLTRVGPACSTADFWNSFADPSWLRALTANNTQFDASQLSDGTWRVTILSSEFSDLSPLKNARISDLNLYQTSVGKLDDLVGLPLRRLRCDQTPCADISPLGSISTLESIVLPGSATRLDALRALPRLRRISYDADAKGEPMQAKEEFWRSLEQKRER